MSLQSVQPTFDIWGLGVQATTKVFEILKACADDDVQGIVLFPLKTFGAWIAVDQDKIVKGQDALNRTQTKTIDVLKVIIGLSNKGLAKELAQDIHLTGAFLFTVACSTCLSIEQTGKLMHEMMVLRKPQTADMINSLAVSKFINSVIGYGDLIGEDDPSVLYCLVQRLLHGRLPRNALSGLEECPSGDQIAKLLHEVFESLQNMEYKHITLEGCQNGVLVATLLLWLRKNDTDLSVEGYRVYPENGSAMARLSINLIRQVDHDDTWKIRKWHPATNLDSTIEVFQLNEVFDVSRPCHHYPLESAKDQMANSGASEQVLDATGHLAAALVDVAFEEGLLCDRGQQSVLRLKVICTQYFVNAYHTIIARFGWVKIISERQSYIADALKNEIAATRAAPIRTDDPADSLRQVIVNCEKRYFQSHGKYMLLKEEWETKDVIERAIHIATEAILFSFCLEHPKRAMYRPHTTATLLRNAEILYSLFFRTVDEIQTRNQSTGVIASFDVQSGRVLCPTTLRLVGYPFWMFRTSVIRAMLQGVAGISPQDLAVASNGYVAHSAALLDIGTTNMTDPRRVSALCIVPGTLRLENKHGRFNRLTEMINEAVLGSYSLNENPKPVQLFMGNKFVGVDQDDASDKSGAKIEHMVSTHDGSIEETAIFLVTYLRVFRNSETPPTVAGESRPPRWFHRVHNVPTNSGIIDLKATSWEQAINAIAFGTHIRDHNLAPAQEVMLAQTWKENGYLGRNMQWLPVGKAANCEVRYYISTTCYDEQLRFFQAGNISQDNRKFFIRQRSVPLMQCIKEAIEACGDKSNWVIIS